MAWLKNIFSVIKNTYDEDLLHYASSLSFHTILSLVPVLLIVLSLFTQLPSFEGYYVSIKELIFSSLLPSQHEVIGGYIEMFLANTLKMGVFGFIFVIIVSMMFFKDFEFVVNKIFHSRQKGFWQSLATYWTLLTLTPIGLAITMYLSNTIQTFMTTSGYGFGFSILVFVPFMLIWGLFYVTYEISASRAVKTKTVVISSFIASLVWYLSKTLFIYYVTYNKTYLSVYGSFSTVMFFFLWIYLSWTIYLYGLKLCYNIDNLNMKETTDISTSPSE